MANAKRIVVLGCGRVGAVLAEDLAREEAFQVTVVDRDPAALAALEQRARVATEVADLADAASVRRLIRPADLVVGAVPGFLGYQTLELVLEQGKQYADIAFMPEDYRPLQALARERGATAVVDCGVAPGISNVLLGKCAAEFDTFEQARILVGGLPRLRTWPYQYKAPFSPIDVIEEYTRPARYVHDGEPVTVEAMEGLNLKEFPRVGVLETFITDGLRSLIKNVKAKNMEERTMRWARAWRRPSE